MQKVLIIVCLLCFGCSKYRNTMVNGLGPMKGVPLLSKINSNKEMDEETKRGMFDGCFSAYQSRGGSFYKTQFYFRQDPKMAANEKYTFAWGRGYTACFSEAIQWHFGFQLGGKAINTSAPGSWWSPIEQKVQMPLGNDAESKPATWYFDESISRGLPGNANYGTNHNFFGVFGSCYAC